MMTPQEQSGKAFADNLKVMLRPLSGQSWTLVMTLAEYQALCDLSSARVKLGSRRSLKDAMHDGEWQVSQGNTFHTTTGRYCVPWAPLAKGVLG